MGVSPTTTDRPAGDIAVGVPVFTRTDALALCLDSIPDSVATVYVADNGPEQDRALYEREWPFNLTVLELPYDCGIGRCRAAIADACTEPYLWVGDCDMEIARDGDLELLRGVLVDNPTLGGISGWLLEGRAVRSGARNLITHRRTAIKEAAGLEVDGDGVPFVRADFIPQAGLFRTAIYEDYCYDPDVRNSEHFDFFYAHTQLAEWEFASTPGVVTIHNRDIDREYRNSERGGNHVDTDILADKWGIERIEAGARPDWARVSDTGLKADAFDLIKQTTPPRVWLPIKRAAEGVGLA